MRPDKAADAASSAAESQDELLAHDQQILFGVEEVEPWRREWRGMPEFVQEDLTSWKSIIVHFATPGDLALFAEAIEQNLTPHTRSIWYPGAEIGRMVTKRYICRES